MTDPFDAILVVAAFLAVLVTVIVVVLWCVVRWLARGLNELDADAFDYPGED